MVIIFFFSMNVAENLFDGFIIRTKGRHSMDDSLLLQFSLSVSLPWCLRSPCWAEWIFPSCLISRSGAAGFTHECPPEVLPLFTTCAPIIFRWSKQIIRMTLTEVKKLDALDSLLPSWNAVLLHNYGVFNSTKFAKVIFKIIRSQVLVLQVADEKLSHLEL